jgi:serine/threonine protein kinase
MSAGSCGSCGSCGSRHSARKTQSIEGSIDSRYNISKKVLGEGAFGKVYKAKRRSDKKNVAVKVILKKHKETCANEVSMLRMLPNHPNVGGFIEVFEDDSYIYIVLEYIEGQNLYEHLKPHLGKKIEEIPHILLILQQMIAAIAAIHSAGIFHRDIKLENFMITFVDGNPVVKLIDFGLSELIGEISTRMVGSPLWMAPEVVRNDSTHSISEEADIWSIGIILLELFLGQPPIDYPDTKKTIVTIAKLTSPPIPKELVDDGTAVGIWVRSIATMCLQIDPTKRPSAVQLVMFSQSCSF